MRSRRRHLLIRAFNTRPPGTTLRDQFHGGVGHYGDARWRQMTRAEAEAALRLVPGSERSERLLSGCFPHSREAGPAVVDRAAFVAFLELGTPLTAPPSSSSCSSLALAVIRPQTTTSSNSSHHHPPPLPRLLLPLPDSANTEHPLRRRPHWRRREVVVEDRVVEYTTVGGWVRRSVYCL